MINHIANSNVIIIEGPDGAGKTGYAKFLASITGYQYKHFSNPKSQAEKDNMFKMYAELLTSGEKLIVDRAWYSDMVYGPIFRGEATITQSQCDALEVLLEAIGGVVIYLTAPLQVCKERAFSRGEDYVSEDKYDAVWQEYERMFKKRRRIAKVICYANR